ncbi:hypothetical protein BDZ89DRAFT_1148431 [Hymenopellis radicata]|nr:hypothetical protein BDZ89DRAFT_1148431 [Hymenopellis radicata]
MGTIGENYVLSRPGAVGVPVKRHIEIELPQDAVATICLCMSEFNHMCSLLRLSRLALNPPRDVQRVLSYFHLTQDQESHYPSYRMSNIGICVTQRLRRALPVSKSRQCFSFGKACDYPSHYAQLSRRDNYFVALRRVKAAEEEYLAAEAIDQQERQICHRLEELQFQRQKASHLHYSSYGAPDHLSLLRLHLKKRRPSQFFNSTRSVVSVLSWNFFWSNDTNHTSTGKVPGTTFPSYPSCCRIPSTTCSKVCYTHLDFTPSHSPASSDTERSLIMRLAYTARNAPVRFHEQSLSGLPSHLDSVESFRDDGLRTNGEVVGLVEGTLEDLEVGGASTQSSGAETALLGSKSTLVGRERQV